MIPTRALRDSITVYFRTYPGGSGSGEGGTDRYGNPIAEESEGVVYPAYVESYVGSRAVAEHLKDEDKRDDYVTVLLSPDAPVDGLARFEWDGKPYEVMGEPSVFKSNTGPHHIEIVGRRVLGG